MRGGVRRFRGTYVRADDAIQFEYDLELRPVIGGMAWFSKVRADGDFRGAPNVVIQRIAFDDPSAEAAARKLVEASIRDRVGVL